MSFDARKLRVIHLRPELLAQIFREGHICEAGGAIVPLSPIPEDLTIICASFDHLRHLIALVAHSNSFTPVPKGIEPPVWELAFARDQAGGAANAAPTNKDGGQG